MRASVFSVAFQRKPALVSATSAYVITCCTFGVFIHCTQRSAVASSVRYCFTSWKTSLSLGKSSMRRFSKFLFLPLDFPFFFMDNSRGSPISWICFCTLSTSLQRRCFYSALSMSARLILLTLSTIFFNFSMIARRCWLSVSWSCNALVRKVSTIANSFRGFSNNTSNADQKLSSSLSRWSCSVSADLKIGSYKTRFFKRCLLFGSAYF